MAKQKHIVNILVKGGIITPSHLNSITHIARENGNTTIGFGSRQQILFEVYPEKRLRVEKLLLEKGYQFEWVENHQVSRQNIVSSYASFDILPSTYWVTSSSYLTLMDQFKESPKLRVNIVDARQKLVPCYSGQLNFVASKTEGYWHLVIKNIQHQPLLNWPVLVHQEDVASLCYLLETYFEDGINLNLWYDNSLSASKFKNLKTTEAIPENHDLPSYYEGFNRMEANQNWWAGFLWRNNAYSIDFLEEVCDLSLRSGIARISITPWKSFLVKDIKPTDRVLWEQLTGRYGINMRHSSFDLYWHLPYRNSDALRLKKRLVRKMDRLDIRTYGLTFSVGKPQFPFTKVLIKEKRLLKYFNIPFLNQYDIFYAKNFDVKSGEYLRAYKNITHKEIHHKLIELSKRFYLKLSHKSKVKPTVSKPIENKVTVHQCADCLSIYHPAFGDSLQEVEAGTAFNELKASYCCTTCGAPKDHFNSIKMASSMFAPMGGKN